MLDTPAFSAPQPRTISAILKPLATAAVLFGVVAMAAVPAQASVLYHTDELGIDGLGGGVNHDDISLLSSNQVDLWWANQFEVQPAGGFITEIHLSFGNNIPVGHPISLLVYDDPNNDGNPSDLVLLREFSATVLESDGTFDAPSMFDIPATQVSGSFFIAALLRDVPGNAGMSFHNEPGESLGRSWLGISATNPGTFDPTDPVNSSVDVAVATIDSLGAPGNWVLRAVGEPVPEPTSLALLALGGLILAQRRRAIQAPR